MNDSEFSGGTLGYIKTMLHMAILIFPTLGIGLPWALCVWYRWSAEHTLIDGHEIIFDGSGADLFAHNLVWLLLCYLSCGLYLPFMVLNLKRWIAEHTHLAE